MKAKWIKEDTRGCYTPGGNNIYHCSNCEYSTNGLSIILPDICPKCKANMEIKNKVVYLDVDTSN